MSQQYQPIFVFEDTVRIYDTDAQGIVHYAGYYRFFTNATEKFMIEKVGIPFPIVNDEFWFVIVESHATYHKPAKLGDRLTVTLTPKALSKKVIRFEYKISTRGELIVDGYTVHVAINPKIWKSREIPDEILNKIFTP
ncbi:MAG: thioesterase family protein [Sulfolobaceae archaeon]|nr:thioesterase family protein [Sulfolobaceae archaeon]